MAIFYSPMNRASVQLDSGVIVPLPFETSDAGLITSITESLAFTDGYVQRNDSFVVDFPDIPVRTTLD